MAAVAAATRDEKWRDRTAVPDAIPRVTEFRETDRADWDAFVNGHARATLFHLSAWREAVHDGLGHRTHYLICRRDAQVVGVLPLAEIRSHLFGHRLISLPGAVYGGVVAADRAAHDALIAAAQGRARALRVAALELRNREATEADWPTSSLYVTFRRELASDDDANLKAIPRKQRAMVRKGVEAGLRTELTEDLRRFYRIYATSVRNLGTPVFPLRWFRCLYEAFPGSTELAIVCHQDRDIAAVMSFWFRDEVLPYYGGSLAVARELRGNDFMYWDLMRRAVRRGTRLFDYGRSKLDSGSYRFKKNWGFAPSPLCYQYDLVTATRPPEVNPNNPRYRHFIAAWRRLPLVVANRLGPLLARDLA